MRVPSSALSGTFSRGREKGIGMLALARGGDEVAIMLAVTRLNRS